ncbi:putative ABC transport system permease protein [Hasllibacter halocynthiae]|uniref:Putative ABC transport system permease protein n=1 Tax=Hasllibacter halocynthiae TaxID=595589 RepID=A0A2T0X186_9RHOB|nr:FtsX-like permease family protein [Hasllibacter halocynthiae]PRY92706.1 putative ABC transport system permease protein [Hasllibacter halocynthiae]
MRAAWRIARRELAGGFRAGLSGFRVFLLCLALGVAAIAAIGLTGEAIDRGLKAEGAVLLGGDAQITLTYRFATPEERAWMDAAGRVSEIAEFRSLARAGGEGALTQVKAVDGAWPLLGAPVLDPPIPLEEALAGDRVVLAPELAARLDVGPGDPVALGSKEYEVSAILVSEPDAAVDFGLGPRTVIRRDALAGAGLMTEGTLFDSAYRIDLPPGADPDALRAGFEARFGGSGARWQDARDGAPGVAEFVRTLEDFLILVGLAGLAVGGVGVSAAVRAYLARKTGVIATLRTLGATRGTVFLAYVMQVGVLALLGVALGLVLGAAIPLALAPVIEAALPIPARFAPYPAPLGEAALYGLLAAALFALPPLARTETVRPAALYRDAAGGGGAGRPRARYLVALAALAAALVGIAALLQGNRVLTLWVAGGVAGALLALTLAAWGLRLLARRLARARAMRGRPALRTAFGAIAGPREEAGAVVLSLGLGLTVLAAIGQIDRNLQGFVRGALPEITPSFFFLDIQPDQLERFEAVLDGTGAVDEIEAAPMLRGIITGIDGRPAAEVAGDHWVLQGDRGVTYAAAPGAREVTEGAWWPEGYDGPPLVSFSADEGRELGLELGSTITVNILGRGVTAEIAAFHEVDFATGGIGFVMVMDPAALQGAPHTWIATARADPGAEGAVLRAVGRALPNVTAVSVRDAVDRAAEVIDGIAGAIRAGALVTLVTGFAVLLGAAAAGVGARVFEAAILRTLGAERGTILLSFALRSALLGAAAGAVALVAGCLGAWGVVTFVMQADYSVAWGNALLIVAGGAAMTLLAGLAFAWRPLRARPAGVLRARD